MDKQMEGEVSNTELSQVMFSWQHPDYISYVKDRRWYVISALLLVAMLAWTIYDQNYFFAIFLVLFYAVVLMYENRPAVMVDFIITSDGIKSGERFYYYREIQNFFIIYRAGGIKNLYIDFKNPVKGRLVVPLDGQNAVAIHDFLAQFLEEDLEREAEPLSEQFRKLLRL
jgi:hypothetical protein